MNEINHIGGSWEREALLFVVLGLGGLGLMVGGIYIESWFAANLGIAWSAFCIFALAFNWAAGNYGGEPANE